MFELPSAFRFRADHASSFASTLQERVGISPQPPLQLQMTSIQAMSNAPSIMAEHPNFLYLAGLVSQAVLEVVFVALPGFLAAWSGMFPADAQKFVAELNTMVFTPCLIFIKLGSQLNADKLADLIIIPFIFVALTLISWVSGNLMARLFGFGRKIRQKNFILAMSVFGNSNSLPISLVLSLSKTISGLHWDRIPGDNDDEVAARGILYLLIFQQLGQLLRWTWGYSVLLKPADAYHEDEFGADTDSEDGRTTEEGRYRDDVSESDVRHKHKPTTSDSGFSSSPSSVASESREEEEIIPATSTNGNNIETEPRHLVHERENGNLGARSRSLGHITAFPSFSRSHQNSSGQNDRGFMNTFRNARQGLLRAWSRTSAKVGNFSSRQFRGLPQPVQKGLSTIHRWHVAFWRGVWRQMNPPLWAMLAGIIVACIPALQQMFFTKGTPVNNSITRAIDQSGGVAVPLILVVLGANLARSTLPKDQLATSPEEKKEERKLLFACLIGRMLIPTVVMAPLLAVLARWAPISIIDDPIFLIVCFLLAGAPSALQLAQICQINNVFMGAMSSLLVASYVVVIFPSTLILVLLALETLEWAQVT